MVPPRAANPLACLQPRWESGSIPTSPLQIQYLDIYGPLAQLVEQATLNRQVWGSIP